MIQETTKVIKLVQDQMKAAQDRQKSYADRHRRELEFHQGEHVFLKVSPRRGIKRFGIKGKLSPRYIGPFEILKRVDEMTYQLALPPQLSNVHDIFHVSMLRKYVYDPEHIIGYQDLDVQRNLAYEERPVQILDRKIKQLRNKEVPLLKIQWNK